MAENADMKVENRSRARGRWRPIALLAVIVLMILLSQAFGLGDKLSGLRSWIRDLGWLGPLVFVGLYIIATVAALPGSALSVAAGALFGPVTGVLVVLIGATLGACLAFLIGRYFAREATAAWLSKNDKFRRLDTLTERHGAIIVAITRLVPIFPFNLLNYGFGLTRVKFRTYALWTALCMTPGIILYVVGAAALFEGLAEGKAPWGLILLVALVAAGIGALAWLARRRLNADVDGAAQVNEK